METKSDKGRGSYDAPKLAKNKKSRKTETYYLQTETDSDHPNHSKSIHMSVKKLIQPIQDYRTLRDSIVPDFTTHGEINGRRRAITVE